MCFSQEVSFTSAVVLAGISALSFQTVKGNSPFFPFALIPLFFALQQFAEGVQWLHFTHSPMHQTPWAQTLFLTVAYGVWPFWISFSLWCVELDEKRKKILSFLAVMGLLLSLFNLYRFFSGTAEATVIDRSIHYTSSVPDNVIWLYAALVIIPWFISSLPKASWAGSAFALSTLLAAYAYFDAFTSVWCFFAAVISVLTYVMLAFARKNSF